MPYPVLIAYNRAESTFPGSPRYMRTGVQRGSAALLRAEQVKPFLSHGEAPVRDYAARYLAASFNPDPSLVPLILGSCDEYGEENCMFMLGCAASFVQTEVGLRQVLGRLARTTNPGARSHYSEMIARADIDVLRGMLPAIRRSGQMTEAAASRVQHRIGMHERSTEELWGVLLEHQGEPETGGRNNSSRGESLVEALAARDDLPANELARHLKKGRSLPPSSEVLLVRLAGAALIAEAAPYLVDRLHAEHDLISIEAGTSLVRLGGTEVVALLHEGFVDGEPRFKHHSASVLGDIKLPQSERVLLDLLRREHQPEVKISLASSLCLLGSVFGLPHAVSAFLRAAPRHRTQEMSQLLYATSRVLGVDPPEI